MPGPNRRIKLFNRLLKEFLTDYESISNKKFTIKVKDGDFLTKYKEQVEKTKEVFLSCNDRCLNSIDLCKTIKLVESPKGVDKYSVWKYLHDLYFLTLEEVDQKILEISKLGLVSCKTTEHLSKFANAIEKKVEKNTHFGNLIQDIAGQVSKSLEGKDLSSLNPMDLVNGLMSGKTSNINGIDFTDILQSTTETIQNKVNTGEIDIKDLQTQAGDLFNLI